MRTYRFVSLPLMWMVCMVRDAGSRIGMLLVRYLDRRKNQYEKLLQKGLERERFLIKIRLKFCL